MDRRGISNTDKAIRYSALESQMMRTFSPKYASYFGDGSGRDTYVVSNNGGLTNMMKPNMMKRPFVSTLKNRNAGPIKDAVPITYHSDGTGRDSYVISNSGGLYQDYGGSHRPDVRFQQSLRFQAKEVLPRTNGEADITRFMNWVNPRT